MKICLFGKGFQSFFSEFKNKYYRNLPGHGILFGLTSLDEKDPNGPKGIVGKFDYNCQDERLFDLSLLLKIIKNGLVTCYFLFLEFIWFSGMKYLNREQRIRTFIQISY